MKNFYIQKNKYKKGFTLVETLVAISIFTVSVVAVMSVIAVSLADISYAKNKIIAGYLAQEGVEYIRNIRDTYILNAPAYGWGVSVGNNFRLKITPCTSPNGCYFDDQDLVFSSGLDKPITKITINSCVVPCPYLYYSSLYGSYNYSPANGVQSPFIRKVVITYPDITGDNEAKVTSTVSWVQGSGTYSIVLSENLFNWTE